MLLLSCYILDDAPAVRTDRMRDSAAEWVEGVGGRHRLDQQRQVPGRRANSHLGWKEGRRPAAATAVAAAQSLSAVPHRYDLQHEGREGGRDADGRVVQHQTDR